MQNELDHVVVVTDESTAFTADEDDVTSSTAASNTPRRQPHKLKNVNVDHFHLGDLFPTLCDGCPRLPSTGLHRAYPRAPGLLCIQFGRPQPIGCTQRLGNGCSSEC